MNRAGLSPSRAFDPNDDAASPYPGRKLRILTFTSLYPNEVQPVNGIFVETRLRQLVESGAVEARVVAPVPWFPFRHPAFGAWSAASGAPRREVRHDLAIEHPRYPTLPKLGMSVAPLLLYAACRATVLRLARSWEFDLIDAHYFYPDGVAAALLARELGKPLVITARGTDINLIPRHAVPRAQILWAARRADGLVSVCAALKERLTQLGVAAERIRVLRNGIDLTLFRPGDRAAARRALGLTGPVILSVGLLIERKGHHLIIAALARLPGVTLLIAGDGPERAALGRLAAKTGVAERVRFLGQIPHESLPRIYCAADALVLASSREGWANVLLEAMASGTPVAATDIWGTREVVCAPEAGVLIASRDATAIASAVETLLAAPPARASTRAYAERFSWTETTQGQIALFDRILTAARA